MKMPLFTNSGMYILQKIEINDQSTFYHKLHNDIIDYSSRVTEILKNLKQTRILVIDFIKLALENIKVDFAKDLYGSFATNLNIETSDIDIQIKIPNENIDVESLINLICSYFASIKIIETISPITTAAIPVIKLSIDPAVLLNINSKFDELKEFCDKNIETIEKYKEYFISDAFKDYIYDINEIKSVKIDLSFVTPSFYNENVVKYVTNQTLINPELVPLNHVIKKFLNLKKLNSCFNGGLASYSLFLILLGFLRYPKSNNQIINNNLGIYLMGFFEFYGKQFDFSKYIIDICNLPK